MTPQELKDKIEYVEHNPASSYWIKKAWEGLKDRDPVDAMEDVELLADICMARWLEIKEKAGVKPC